MELLRETRSGALVVGVAPGDRLVQLLGLLLRGVLEVDVVLEVARTRSITRKGDWRRLEYGVEGLLQPRAAEGSGLGQENTGSG